MCLKGLAQFIPSIKAFCSSVGPNGAYLVIFSASPLIARTVFCRDSVPLILFLCPRIRPVPRYQT